MCDELSIVNEKRLGHELGTTQEEMRKFWEDHITPTGLYLVSAAADLPDKDATTQCLLENQADIGDAIKPFDGDTAGAKLTELLRDHILISADVIDAALIDKTNEGET